MPHCRWRFGTFCLEYLGHTQVVFSVIAKYPCSELHHLSFALDARYYFRSMSMALIDVTSFYPISECYAAQCAPFVAQSSRGITITCSYCSQMHTTACRDTWLALYITQGIAQQHFDTSLVSTQLQKQDWFSSSNRL